MGFPGGLDDKESTCNVGDLGLIPGLGRSPGGGHGSPIQYSCLGISHGAEEPGGLQSMRLQRVGHNLATKQQHNAISLILSHIYLYNMRMSNLFFPFLLFLLVYQFSQFSSVAQSCPTLCDPINHSTPGLPVHRQLPEFTQTHVHRVSDAIQPSHPLSSPLTP